MKNIHVIKTDKPSSLSIIDSQLIYSKKYFINPQHIYITSNEEIKEGVNQWYLDKVWNKPCNSGCAQYSSKQDVIILTTDQDLIKDGVQQIEDDFLEWFVKNPNCEEVEIKDITTIPALQLGSPNGHLMYKIIITQENKQKTLEQTVKELSQGHSLENTLMAFANLGAEWQANKPIEDLSYWKLNAEENYSTTPISVLKYISELEKL
jgi:hypothetical protein